MEGDIMKEIIKLGELLGSTEQRDAIHVAVIPCVTTQILDPGQHVGIKVIGPNCYMADRDMPHVGIVDPFLAHPIGIKHRFYVLLYPNTIESLRHVWRHPIIDGDAK